jgi:hypothetical protein
MRGQANTISFQTVELAPGIKGSLMAIMELLAVQTIPLSRSNYLRTILLGRFREKLDIAPT